MTTRLETATRHVDFNIERAKSNLRSSIESLQSDLSRALTMLDGAYGRVDETIVGGRRTYAFAARLNLLIEQKAALAWVADADADARDENAKTAARDEDAR